MATSRIVSSSSAVCIRQQRRLFSLFLQNNHNAKHSPSISSCRQYAPANTAVNNNYMIRWKHSSKMGNHLEKLDDLAHGKSREEAVERRQKKKEKTAARKGKKHKHDDEDISAPAGRAEDVQDDDDYAVEDDDEDDEEDEDVLPDPQKVKERMKAIVARFEKSLKAIRGAEPTVELFDTVQVDAYGGAKTSLQSVAQVVIVEHTLATATCFDPSVTKAVQTALYQQLELNASISEDGVLRIPLPKVSMETRQKTAAVLQKRAESVRQRIRKVRRKALSTVKLGVAGKLEGISKDDAFRVQQEIEAICEEVIQTLNKTAEEKHDSIMLV
jgi:ribosome recycling factor